MFADKIKSAARLIKDSHYTVALTGAGISTPSGIPDFRSPGSGLWSKVDPMEVATIWAFKQNPHKFYEFMFPISQGIASAEPNPAHYALAELEAKNRLSMVITQNIDNLHQKAGSQNVIEVHGNVREVICLRCRKITPTGEFLKELEAKISDPAYYPKCKECQGLMKPNVILFGEALPQEALFTAYRAAEECEVMMVVGSSLVVQPACSLPQVVVSKGAKVIVVNLEPTYIDSSAQVVIQGKVEEVLPEIIKQMEEN